MLNIILVSFNKIKMIGFIILFGLLFGNINGLNAQPTKEYLKKYKNGQKFKESKKIPGVNLAFVLKEYYDNGTLMREESWILGKRNGLTKVYSRSGRLIKEINFKDNYILSYISYRNNNVYTKISADRSEIFYKGRRINVRWDKYYELYGSNRILSFDKKELIDWLANFMVPEDIVEIVGKLSDFFDAQAGVGANGMDDILACGGTASIMNDKNVDLMASASKGTLNQNVSKSTKGNFGSNLSNFNSTKSQVANSIVNTCADNARGSLGASGGVGGFNQQRQNDVNKARSSLQTAIASCREQQNRGSSGMFSVTPVESAGLTAAEAEEILAMIESFISERTVETATLEATEGAAVRSAAGNAARGFVTMEVAGVAAGAAVLAVTGVLAYWGPGQSIAEGPVGKAIEEGIKNVQEYFQDMEVAAREAEERQRIQEERRRAADNAATQSGSSAPSSGGSTTPSASMPLPEGLGAGDPCTRMESFLSYCDNTNWRDMKCENYIRTIKKCVGNITQMYVAGDGNVYNVGCPMSGDPAQLAEAECKRKGLVARPVDGGNICASKRVELPRPDISDPNVTDPVRGDFGDLLANKNVSMMIDTDLNSVLNSSKPTMVVFMDPNCGSCMQFSKTMKSDNFKKASSMFDVKIVDVNQFPELIEQFKVAYLPTYFVAKSGKKSKPQAGALDEKSLLKFITDNQNPTTK